MSALVAAALMTCWAWPLSAVTLNFLDSWWTRMGASVCAGSPPRRCFTTARLRPEWRPQMVKITSAMTFADRQHLHWFSNSRAAGPKIGLRSSRAGWHHRRTGWNRDCRKNNRRVARLEAGPGRIGSTVRQAGQRGQWFIDPRHAGAGARWRIATIHCLGLRQPDRQHHSQPAAVCLHPVR